jgi:two-component system cell cycle sensor histidine kinase/response regulator CckA
MYMNSEHSPARVLVVDSEDAVRVLVARMLRERGYDVVEAANGRVALDLLSAASDGHYFAVVVTNSRLPGVSGYELIAEMLKRFPHLQVVHISGHPDALADARFHALDRVTTLAKPFTAEALTEAVDQRLHAAGLETAPVLKRTTAG